MSKLTGLSLLCLLLRLCAFTGYAQPTPPTPTTVPTKRPPPEIPTKFPRQAPWCVTDLHEPELIKFKPIFDYHNNYSRIFVPVAPDKEQSPTGFIRNISLSRIYINAKPLPQHHLYRTFHNYFHMTFKAVDGSEGMEGLYVQSIGAPLGVPFGEFVTDFDCRDCSIPSSELESITSIVPCQFIPAASYMHPTVISIGGKAGPVRKFKEAHFNFRYVDYPCFDVTFAQFLIIAVRDFKKLEYEVFFSPLFKVNIEAVGAPYPMYYGWKSEDIICHHRSYTYMDNWFPAKNQKVKIKYSREYDLCTYNENNKTELGSGNICKPGPVTCGTEDYQNKAKEIPRTGSQWTTFREKYSRSLHAGGTDLICTDCGEWEEKIGKPNWTQPPVTEVIEEITITEIIITRPPIVITYITNITCEERDRYAKNINNSRSVPEDNYCGKGNFDDDVAHRGMSWTKALLTAHDIAMVFSWTVASNCLIYCARFLKEASFAEKGSGCFGIGKWLWEHIFWTYMCATSLFAGVFFVAYPDAYDICQAYNLNLETDSCKEWDLIHRVMGIIVLFIFFMGFISGWYRPKNKLLRNIVIIYHMVSGYLAKYLGLLNIITAPGFLDSGGVVFLVMTEVTFLLFCVAGTLINWKMDTKMKYRIRGRKMFPVPEGIETLAEAPLKNWRALLFPFLVIVQLLLFTFLVFFEFGGRKDDQDFF